MDNLQLHIGQTIIRLRKERNMSQETLALSADIDRHYMSDIENGRRNISVDFLEKIARSLEIRGSELLAMAEESVEKKGK